MKTAVGAPAPRPSDEEMLDAIAHLTVREMLYLLGKLAALVNRRQREQRPS